MSHNLKEFVCVVLASNDFENLISLFPNWISQIFKLNYVYFSDSKKCISPIFNTKLYLSDTINCISQIPSVFLRLSKMYAMAEWVSGQRTPSSHRNHTSPNFNSGRNISTKLENIAKPRYNQRSLKIENRTRLFLQREDDKVG